jgi:signal transduction histidine kinase
VDTTIVPFVDGSGRPHQYIAIRYDITERKRSEAALRDQASLARLGTMAAVVAHEVRNPLAGIRGALQIVGRRLAPTSQEAAVIGEVVARIDTLDAFVEDLLLFARPRSPVLSETSLPRLVEKHVALLKVDPRFAEIAIHFDVPEESIRTDPVLLGQALMNLLINSAQAMDGRGDIRIAARRQNGWHEVRIIDHGPGIPSEVREHLFEPFFTTRNRGTGLGLATARQILEAHGGSIDFECPAAGGTIFTLRLPAP